MTSKQDVVIQGSFECIVQVTESEYEAMTCEGIEVVLNGYNSDKNLHLSVDSIAYASDTEEEEEDYDMIELDQPEEEATSNNLFIISEVFINSVSAMLLWFFFNTVLSPAFTFIAPLDLWGLIGFLCISVFLRWRLVGFDSEEV